ncbi:hypothetical protein, conserved [Leishmania tarentolae]|uniref:Secreted protein n=1 Tax=Leishmania tarentolae TaxID=5689 RepID=A0A640KCC2_LEITA|nr:hypothetical protein, conserved [Leishmania tarentolae]
MLPFFFLCLSWLARCIAKRHIDSYRPPSPTQQQGLVFPHPYSCYPHHTRFPFCNCYTSSHRLRLSLVTWRIVVLLGAKTLVVRILVLHRQRFRLVVRRDTVAVLVVVLRRHLWYNAKKKKNERDKFFESRELERQAINDRTRTCDKSNWYAYI